MDATSYLQDKYNLDLNQKSPIEIPNVGRLDIIRWLRELDLKVGVEVGVAAAEFAKLIVEGNPQLKLYGVDPWLPYRGYSDYTRKETFNTMYDEAKRRLKGYEQRGRFEFIREFSMDALPRFADNSLDFAYIDANHQAPFVDQDITEWTKKVKPGGLVAGHDYVRVRGAGRKLDWGVKDAIHKYAQDNNLTWFVLGTNAELIGEVRDGSRSWAFVRPS